MSAAAARIDVPHSFRSLMPGQLSHSCVGLLLGYKRLPLMSSLVEAIIYLVWLVYPPSLTGPNPIAVRNMSSSILEY